jgi:hypothetical protein
LAIYWDLFDDVLDIGPPLFAPAPLCTHVEKHSCGETVVWACADWEREGEMWEKNLQRKQAELGGKRKRDEEDSQTEMREWKKMKI